MFRRLKILPWPLAREVTETIALAVRSEEANGLHHHLFRRVGIAGVTAAFRLPDY